jgi:cytochrome c-type biogenesis protein
VREKVTVGEELSLWVAFAGGFISFASPCVLPLMPGYIGYITGVSAEEAEKFSRRTYLAHVMVHTLIFGLGFTTIFVTFGLTATSIGGFLSRHALLFQRVAGLLIILFGLQMTGLLKVAWLYRERRFTVKERDASVTRSFILGMAFGFGWTPCIGPVLGAVLTMAASQEQILSGGILLLAYSLGMGIPFLLTAAALALSLSFADRTGRFLHYVHVGAGVIMLVMGLLLLTGAFSKLSLFFNTLAV